MTGVLNVKVAGTWVPLAVGVTTAGLPPPAYGGPKIDNVNVARFGNTGGDQNVGYLIANDGYIDAVMGAAKSLVFWDTAHGSNYIGKFSYDTGRGQLDIGRIYVPSGTGQHITLYGTVGSSNTFGTGIQSSTLYNRVGSTSTNGFAWYQGGVHSDTAHDPGAGGKTLMRMDGSGTFIIGEGALTVSPLRVVGTNDQNNYISYYSPSPDNARIAYLGFPNTDTFYIKIDRAASHVRLDAPGVVMFAAGGSEKARIDSNGLLIGKTSSNEANTGCELMPDGRAKFTDNAAGTVQTIVCNLRDSAVSSGRRFVSFRLNNVECGTITRNAATSAVLYNTTSDYRLKDVIGPITQPVERVKRLRPVHFAWKDSGTTADGFLAHEVQEAESGVVSGEKDAVDENGEIIPQGMDASKLIPLLTAALQEALITIESMQRRLDILEAR